jgi:Protein of unknown function (DUF3995)
VTNYIIPVLLFVSLGAISCLHLLWAMGNWWPARDAETLSSCVLGDPTFPGMAPPPALRLTAAAIAFAAFDGLALGFHFGEIVDKGAAWIGVGLIAVFAVRGVVGYLPFWRAAHPGIVFAKLDKLFYSPFCILVAEGFFTLVSDRF